MKRLLHSFLVLAAALALLPAGCPQELASDSARQPSSGSAGGASDEIGPRIPESDGTAGGGDSGPITVGGDTSDVTTSPDALSVDFPGCEEPAEAAFWRSEVLRLMNQERTAAGTGTLTWSPTLEDQATQYACELIHYDFFDHENTATGTTLADRAAEFGYDYWIIGENLAAGQRSPVEAVTDWMDSPCHRENILNPAFTELGVGIRFGGEYGYYWVQEFGRPFSEGPYGGPRYRDPDCPHDD